jgi:hypothetical protein
MCSSCGNPLHNTYGGTLNTGSTSICYGSSGAGGSSGSAGQIYINYNMYSLRCEYCDEMFKMYYKQQDSERDEGKIYKKCLHDRLFSLISYILIPKFIRTDVHKRLINETHICNSCDRERKLQKLLKN